VSRVRVGLGLVAVAAGTAWAVGGIGSVATSARRLAELLPLLLVLGGALAILLVVVPRGTLAGPVLLVSVGLLGLAAEDGMLRKLYLARIPALILVGAGVIVAMSRSEKIHVDTGVKRFTAFLFPAHRTLRGETPAKIIARAIFGLLKVDMSHTAPSLQTDRVWVDVTCIAGRIEIILPKEWEVKPGRVALARRIRFEGALPGTDIGPAEQGDQRDQNLVVINVLGWLGFVVVQRT
jgi:hypothetical protein